jgi:ribosomal-protein-alanine N-acetyltransferase
MTPCLHTIERIMTVMEAAFDPAYGEAWNLRQVTDALTLSSTHALVVDGDGEPIPEGPNPDAVPAGFFLTRHVLDEEELLLIGVAPLFRQRGLGTRLIEQMFAMASRRGITRVYLEMRRGNPAYNLYRKLGFEPIGERRKYYRMANGERVDAITFGRSI